MATAKLFETVTNRTRYVDRQAGVIHGVRILGKQSKNGYEYSDRAMEQAARLYEGVRVNIDHPPRNSLTIERKLTDRFGSIRGSVRNGDAVFGDLHFFRSHPLADYVCDLAEGHSTEFGLSHVADGEKVHRGGKVIVESIDSVRSVDIVDRPATNRGLFESVRGVHLGTVANALAYFGPRIPSGPGAMLAYLRGELVEMAGDQSGPMPFGGDQSGPMPNASGRRDHVPDQPTKKDLEVIRMQQKQNEAAQKQGNKNQLWDAAEEELIVHIEKAVGLILRSGDPVNSQTAAIKKALEEFAKAKESIRRGFGAADMPTADAAMQESYRGGSRLPAFSNPQDLAAFLRS